MERAPTLFGPGRDGSSVVPPKGLPPKSLEEAERRLAERGWHVKRIHRDEREAPVALEVASEPIEGGLS
jgi:hypothetical protein